MDLDQRVKLVIGGAVVLLILVVIAAVVFFGRLTQTDETASLDSLSSLQTTPATTTTPEPRTPEASSTDKQYLGADFSLKYPSTWGLLTCNNSANFEFDPSSATDTKVACNRAIKPVTVLVVSGLNCQGDLVTLGGKQVLKAKTTDQNGDVDYRWCLSAAGNTGLDITHRVSKSGAPASSKEDLSSQIEDMIKTITATPRGS